MEGFGGHHEGVAKHVEVCAVVHFFGEDVAWVDETHGVVEIHFLSLDAVADGAVFEADVTHTLGGDTFGPVDGTLVINVEAGGSISIGEVHVVAPMAKRENFFDSFIHGTVGRGQIRPS